MNTPLTMERVYDAPVSKVWEALTNLEQIVPSKKNHAAAWFFFTLLKLKSSTIKEIKCTVTQYHLNESIFPHFSPFISMDIFEPDQFKLFEVLGLILQAIG